MTQIMDTFSKLNGNKYSPGVITGKPISWVALWQEMLQLV